MPRHASASLPALLLVVAACASAEKADRNVAWLVNHGRYDEAVELADREARRRPNDERAQENHRLASTAWLLERGRRLAFAGRNQEAFDALMQARSIAPESEIVQGWIEATRDRLADEWFDKGLAAHNAEDLEQAAAGYEKALSFRPQHYLARESLARVLLQLNYRAGLGEEYYDNGVRELDRYFLYEANSSFIKVLDLEPENDRAERRRDQTEELLAVERAAMAADLEDQGEYAAARNEYRLALLLDPALEQAQRGFEAMQREEQVAELMREAEREFLQHRYAEAEARLVEAEARTDRQGPVIEERRAQLQEARIESLYDAARTYESDWRYEEAVEAYNELLELQPFYEDAIARRDTLQDYVEQARQLYASYEAATSDEERLNLLRQIEVFWPEYRDVRLRLAELEGRAGAKP